MGKVLDRMSVALNAHDLDGFVALFLKALQILESPGLVEAWPLELRITPETHPATEPSTPGLVTWQPSSQDQLALP